MRVRASWVAFMLEIITTSCHRVKHGSWLARNCFLYLRTSDELPTRLAMERCRLDRFHAPIRSPYRPLRKRHLHTPDRSAGGAQRCSHDLSLRIQASCFLRAAKDGRSLFIDYLSYNGPGLPNPPPGRGICAFAPQQMP